MIRNTAFAAVTALALSGAFAASALAEPVDYAFDKTHANITFTINHLGFSTAHGRFNTFDGALTIDEETPANSAVTVTIATDSLDTFYDKRNEHLKSKDFFNVAEFPEMTFKSTSVEKTGDDMLKMTGDLTMLGVTKPVTLDVTVPKLGAHPMSGAKAVGFHATGTIKRSEWGMTTFVPAVSDEVDIVIDLEAAAK
ncbi:polyisoprenoid-binding protein YceI [Rhodobium orientis]|uniref:Polyisoprenoid-binding protein n=1 Tax=Rhodobium orientis TaxID=34017 RepID=A0A327JVI8_9HYPH|nr:YceI family protein [Rhodobium orientis]MBB4304062.1 polyisoprenoid-binding protein YceI [Rhodobium orientis]MBK5950733.1 polyisoprenoid-binding protein [Rhodobium orientis]RAI29595.1 polyisoprenoid-binding protein [Rhodobium orientis]